MKTIDDNWRDDLLARMIDAPETLTAEDVRLIQEDEELMELYDAAVLCKEACVADDIEIPDVEAELAQFKQARRKTVPLVARFRPLMRVAAIFMGVAVASLVVVAAFKPSVFDFSYGAGADAVAEVNEVQIPNATGTVGVAEAVAITNESELVYDNVTLDSIMDEIAKIYQVKVSFADGKARELRLYIKIEPGKTVQEVVEALSAFEQFDISYNDNVITIK